MKNNQYKGFCMLLIALVLFSNAGFAQRQNEWHIGYHMGSVALNFNTNPPAVISSNYLGTGSGSTITDHSGELLFYTNGDQVWDRNHNLMPNGDGLVWTGSCGWYGSRTQADGTIIQPIPFDSNRYYIFTIPFARCMDPSGQTNYYPSNLYYSIVDMRLNGGLGDVVQNEKGVLIDQGLSTGGLCIVPGNNCDYWLLAHTYYLSNSPYYLGYNQNPPDTVLRETGLLAYHITESGINMNPVHSVINDFTYQQEMNAGWGNIPIVVSPDRSQLLVHNLLGKFDPNTGVFSDYFRLFISNSFSAGCFGCSIDNAVFSSNGGKLYVRANPVDGWGYGIYSRVGIFQFDISEFHYYPIRQSMKVVFSQWSETTLPEEDWRTIGQIRLTPYNEIYFFSRAGTDWIYGDYTHRVKLNTITNPDADFDDLVIQEDILNLGPDSLHFNRLPTPIHDKLYISDTIFNVYSYPVVCKEQTLSIPSNAINILWEDSSATRSRIVGKAGSYHVEYQLPHELCRMYVDSFKVEFYKWEDIELDKISPICEKSRDGMAVLRFSPDWPDLSWQFIWKDEFNSMIHQSMSREADSVTGLLPGDYQINIRLSNGCDTVIPFTIEIFPQEELFVTPDYVLLKYGDSIQLETKGYHQYIWYPDNSLDKAYIPDPVAFPRIPTVYEVIGVDENGCRDTTWVKVDIDFSMPDLVPNAFSPNGDGLNDVFRVENLTYQLVLEMSVFNRMGQCVFYSPNGTKGWDGTFQGQPCDQGTYFYLIRIAYPDGQQKTLKGDIVLLR